MKQKKAQTPLDSATLQIEQWPVDRPRPYKRNARKITPEAVEKVAVSLREFGWRQPIVVDTRGVIIVGHTRLMAARRLGMTTVPVHVARGLTMKQVRAYRLMDNRSHDETGWDNELLAVEISDLKEIAFDVSLTGFDADEVDKLLKKLADQSNGDAPDQSGDIQAVFQILVTCGDEQRQGQLLERLAGEGWECRALLS